jgi:mannose/fructose-specific phosphotransferase system component IIA
MSDELRGVVVCHGRLAGALVEAAEQISGVTGALTAVTNTGCDRGTLEERVAEAVGAGPAVVFVDLASGSCLFAVLNRLRAVVGAKVVTGVNLAMLVDFVFHRTLPPEEAAARAAIAGGKAIRVP